MPKPQATPIAPGVIARAVAGLRYAVTGNAPDDWFGPGEPMQPVAPQAAGRQFDYPFAHNIQANKPRAGEAINFDHLRTLADSYDLLRLLIETRKDQLAALDWTIRPADQAATPDADTTARCAQLQAWFKRPDRENPWADWLRMLLEDLLVLDAPTLYKRRTNGGQLYALEPIDGATIKRLIDYTGRTPADGPAYQQIIKGMPAVDYTRDELLYRPRNRRTHKVYGYSPVEQIIMTVNIALRRQLHTLDYYTQGSVPDALVGVPQEWSTDQIKQFQEYWDILMSNEDGAGMRRKMRFVPGEVAKNLVQTKQPPLKDVFDEWLARVVCYAFSVEPTPFIAQTNRAVAQTVREQSLSEGLIPLRNWVKTLIDDIIAHDMGAPDLVFSWVDDEVIDARGKAQIETAYVNAKIKHPDEVRAGLGLPPLTAQQQAQLSAGKNAKHSAPNVNEHADAEVDTSTEATDADAAAEPTTTNTDAQSHRKAAVLSKRTATNAAPNADVGNTDPRSTDPRTTDPLTINVTLPHITVSPPQVTVDVAGTTVHAHIEPPSAEPSHALPTININVEPTPVTLEATLPTPNVTVVAQAAPAEVTVNNEVIAQAAPAQVVVSHPAQSVAVHERDPRTQEVLRTVTTHKPQD